MVGYVRKRNVSARRSNLSEWSMTPKLGSPHCEVEDVAHRKPLANVAFRKLWTVWLRRSHICPQLRLKLYASFVVPVLTYIMETWGLTKSELERMDAYHRRPTSVRRHSSATPYIERGAVPPLPMPLHQ